MIFSNLNFITIFLFLIINLFLIYFIFKRKSKDFKIIFLFLSFFCIFISILGIWYFWKILLKKNDILFILDVSKSMQTSDILGENWYISRLDFSKNYISNFIKNNKNNNYSLIIFSWKEAKIMIPFSENFDFFLKVLQGVDYKNLNQTQWTDFLKPFELENKKYSKTVVFISDWWDEEDKVSPSLKQFYNKKNNYYIIWVWSEKWWKIPLWENFFWEKEYKKYNWQEVISKISLKNLSKIADIFKTKFIFIDKQKDFDFLKNDFSEFLEEKTNLENKISFSRILWFFSFWFFILFLIFYLFEQKKYEF